jgi:polar amino acid transport system permease protein
MSTPTASRDAVPFTPSEIEQARRKYRRDRARRSTIIAAISTVVVIGGIVAAVLNTPGWPAAHQAFFNGAEFKDKLGGVARAFLIDLKLLVISEPCVLVLAMVIALARISRGAVAMPLRVLSAVYVDLFRGCPLIIELFLFSLGVPALQISWLPTSPTIWAGVAIILNYTSYVSEVFRAGIQSVHPSQRAASRSLGLTQGQTLRSVVFPQAARNVLPALLNDFIALQKDVGLAGAVGGVTDAVQQAYQNNALDFNFTSFIIAALFFVALAVPTRWLADWYVRRKYGVQLAGVVV